MRHFVVVGFLFLVLHATTARADDPAVSGLEDFTQVTCAELAQQTEEDRAFTLVFYYGYTLGRQAVSVIDSDGASAQFLEVRDYCTANPESTVVNAFTQVLEVLETE